MLINVGLIDGVGFFSFSGNTGNIGIVLFNITVKVGEVLLEGFKSGVVDGLEELGGGGNLDFNVGDLSFKSGNFGLVLEGSFVVGFIIVGNLFFDVRNQRLKSFVQIFNGSAGHNVEFGKSDHNVTDGVLTDFGQFLLLG